MPVLVVGLFVIWYVYFSLGAKLVGLFLCKNSRIQLSMVVEYERKKNRCSFLAS